MKRIEAQIRELGLSKAKETICLLLIDGGLAAFAVGLYLWRGDFLFALYPLALIFVADFMLLSRYGKALKRKNDEREGEFVRLFSYFGIYISNGDNVYVALKKIAVFASPEMKERLGELVMRIDGDKTVSPFVEFASVFSSVAIKEVLISVFQMVEEGGGLYVSQFSSLFGRFAEERYKLEREKKVARLGTLAASALVASGIVMVMITIGLIEILGEVINGI